MVSVVDEGVVAIDDFGGAARGGIGDACVCVCVCVVPCVVFLSGQ